MVTAGPPPGSPLDDNAREELSDARLLLDTAVHNVAAALRASDPVDVHAAIAAALTMAGQAHGTLARVAGSIA